jgi:hypothetical protein
LKKHCLKEARENAILLHAKQAPIDLAALTMVHFNSVGARERIMKNHTDEKPAAQTDLRAPAREKTRKLAAALKRNLLRRKASERGRKPGAAS